LQILRQNWQSNTDNNKEAGTRITEIEDSVLHTGAGLCGSYMHATAASSSDVTLLTYNYTWYWQS